MVERLRRGQTWLAERWRGICAGESMAATEPDTFTRTFMAWVDLEKTIRFVYEYEGCVIGDEGCDPAAPACCEACVGTWRQGLGPEEG